MKTTDVFFKDTNFVGREVENVQDLVKALDAGMNIADAEGNGYTSGYDDEDEDGDWFWHEKTEEELFTEMRGDLDRGSTVYAGFFINSKEYSIKPSAATTLQSKFRIGQDVYTMEGNKIRKATIEYLSLSVKGKSDEGYIRDAYLGETAKELYYKVGFMFKGSMPSYPDYDKLKAVKAEVEKNFIGDYAIVRLSGEKYDSARKRTLSDIFATKEDLVKCLMEG